MCLDLNNLFAFNLLFQTFLQNALQNKTKKIAGRESKGENPRINYIIHYTLQERRVGPQSVK